MYLKLEMNFLVLFCFAPVQGKALYSLTHTPHTWFHPFSLPSFPPCPNNHTHLPTHPGSWPSAPTSSTGLCLHTSRGWSSTQCSRCWSSWTSSTSTPSSSRVSTASPCAWTRGGCSWTTSSWWLQIPMAGSLRPLTITMKGKGWLFGANG